MPISITRIQDKWNPSKVWVIRKYKCGHFTANQDICGNRFYKRNNRISKKRMASIGLLNWI
jgi:hypothetical protein